VDVRVIAATSRNLKEAVALGRFRADLFYRLNGTAIHIPPLRERPEDIPVLIDYFLALYRERFKRPALEILSETRQRLTSHSWPGNVRELRTCLERAIGLSTGDVIEIQQILPQTDPTKSQEYLPERIADPSVPPPSLAQIERDHIMLVLQRTSGNRERAAAILGISSRTLYRKLREYESAPDATIFVTGN
jgi:two-component system response regulator HydG